MTVIAHNITAMNTQRQYGINSDLKSKTTEKLASGYRINSAADDAAGLAISEKMRSQIRGITQGVQNTEEGISLCHVADGALHEVSNMLHRMKELAVQSANGTNTDNDRANLQDEMSQILEEIDRIGEDTEFNELKVFCGNRYTTEVLEVPAIMQNAFSGTKQEFIQNYENAVLNGSDNAIQADTNTPVLITKDNINNYLLSGYGTRIYEFPSGTYQISDDVTHISGMRFNLSGDVTICNSVLDNIELYCEECNLTLSNVTSNMEGYSHYTGSNIYFRGDSNSLTFIGENVLRTNRSYPAIAVSGTFEMQGNGTLDVIMDNNSAMGIAKHEQAGSGGQAGADIIINSGNINLVYTNTVDADVNSFQNGIGNYTNNINYIGKLEVNGGNLNVQLTQNGSTAIIAKEMIVTGGSVLASAPDFNRSAFINDSEKNGYGIITERFTQTGGSILAIGRTSINGDIGSALHCGGIQYSQTMTEDGYNYYLSTAETYKQDYIIEYMKMGPQLLWIQSGANEGQGMWLEVDAMNTQSLGIVDVDISTMKGSNDALVSVREALAKLSKSRSKIGAQQNRLEHTADRENVSIENLTASESRIRDTDMAFEMVCLSKYNILEQTGQAMMAQANQNKQGVLQLLTLS